MTRKTRVRLNNVKTFAILMFTAVFSLLAIPFGALRSLRTATAEVETATDINGAQPPVQTSADEGDTYELTFNYYSKDSASNSKLYDGWTLWAWADGVDGNSYAFTAKEIDGKAWITSTVTLNIAPKGDKIFGVIARKGATWDDGKVINVDSWVTREYFTYDEDAKKYVGEVFMADTETEVYKNAQDAIDHKVIRKVTNATFTNFKTVTLELNIAAEDTSVFNLKKNGETIKTASVANKGFKKGDKKITFDLGDSFVVDFGATYTVFDEPTVAFDEETHFPKRDVTIGGLYTTEEFGEKYNYNGVLGAQYTAQKTTFTVWSPYASSMSVKVYEKGDASEEGDAVLHDVAMTSGEKGVWTAQIEDDLKGKYYTYVVSNGSSSNEIVDPYARSAGRNGVRGMILDLKSTNPEGWDTQKNPELKSYSEAVIYEAHLRDLTIHESSGVSAANRGKFLGLTETGTKNSKGQSTALDYLKELGVTQVHFQPLFDFASVNEDFEVATFDRTITQENGSVKGEFNWGYDPLNYNMPEGSYSSNPADGYTRVNEMKQMIMALHNAGIQVVMDVVYNHVSGAADSNFEALMPGYYFRMNSDGTYVNASGCGNVTASERYMFRKFMIDSVKYWTEEYKIDGFRFDLMGCHDWKTMNEIYEEVAKLNPDVIIYGEGWNGGTDTLAESDSAKMANAKKMPNIAFFNDTIRDGLKGSVFADEGYLSSVGFVSGKKNEGSSVYNGARGGGKTFSAPTQSVNYVASHDNSLLWDRLKTSVNDTDDNIKAMYRMAAVSVLTSQGIAFMPAGEEMLRSKKIDTTKVQITGKAGDWRDAMFDGRPYNYLSDSTYFFSDNSYRSLDHVNAINWELLDTNKDMVAFYKALIQIKRNLPQFRLTTSEQITENVTLCDPKTTDGMAFYAVKDPNSNSYAVLMFNNQTEAKEFDVPNGTYKVLVNGANATADLANPLSNFDGDKFEVGARSAVLMIAELDSDAIAAWKKTVNPASTPTPTPGDNTGDKTEGNNDDDSNLGLALGLGIGIPAAVLVAGGVAFGMMYGKKKKGKGGNSDNGEIPETESDDQPEQPKTEENSAEETPEQPEE
ncbi:MAG: type I pullulanase [Clostridiales bacterium]|nr:type I pullulanase [Clostridiales bacterium]